MNLRVSVIIPTYNFGRFVKESIQSVLVQTIGLLEIIVIDDGSTDDTAEVVTSIKDERLRYVRQENAGVSAARNRGAAESRGEYIAFCDADDVWEPTKLEKQIALFEADREIGLVDCGMREFNDETGQTIGFYLDGGSGWVADALLLWEGPVVVGPGGTIVVTREAFDTIGGFDERQKVGEDWDFCYRVARKYKVGFVPEPLVNYRSHGGAAHRSVAQMEKGMTLFYQKAFASGDEHVMSLKNRALSNFHKVLSGSYFDSREYSKSLSHAVKSIALRPGNAGYFLQFPLRRLRRTLNG
jgi:glycosyltransferase involved in cell wall biosynthesis